MSDMTAFTWMIALPLLATPVIYLIGRLARDDGRAARWAALIALLITWIPFAQAASDLGDGPQTYTLGAIALRLDDFALLLAALSLGLGTLVTLYSGPYMQAEEGQEKYYASLVAVIGVMIGLGCAADLFNLWVWFEAMAVSTFLLVAFYHEQPASLEAGVKYLVQSAVGSVLVLMGIALVLAETGSLDLATIRAEADSAPAASSMGVLSASARSVARASEPVSTWMSA